MFRSEILAYILKYVKHFDHKKWQGQTNFLHGEIPLPVCVTHEIRELSCFSALRENTGVGTRLEDREGGAETATDGSTLRARVRKAGGRVPAQGLTQVGVTAHDVRSDGYIPMWVEVSAQGG